MNYTQALRRSLALLAGMFMLTAALAMPEPAEEGTDYKRLSKPVAVETGNKIEVAVFFWYGCPHCNQLDPALEKWAKKLPPDAVLHPIPAIFKPDWIHAAKLYYALDDLGVRNRLHGKVFEAYHKDKLDLDDEAQLMAWVKKQGLDQTKFKAAYKSFSSHTRAMKGSQKVFNAFSAAAVERPGVPALLVDGKYITSVSMAITEERLFEVLDDLIQRARNERKGKASKK